MAAFSLLAIVFRTILCMWPRPGGPNRIADSMPRASLDCDDAIDPCVCVLEAFLGAWDRIRQMFVVLVAMFHPVVHRRDCVRHRGGGRGGRRGIKFSAAPPSPQPGTGGFRESGRPLTAQDLDGLAVSWRLFWAWRTGGSTRVSSERVLQAPGHRIDNISNTIGGGSLAVVHFALPRRHGNSLPPSVPPFHLRRHHPPIPDRPPIGPMPYLIQCHHPHACRRGGVLRREPHGTTGLNELTHVVCLAALHPPKTTAAASA